MKKNNINIFSQIFTNLFTENLCFYFRIKIYIFYYLKKEIWLNNYNFLP
jgi:hypothetical protein